MEDIEKYVGIQKELREKIRREDQLPEVMRAVAGVDQSYNPIYK